MPRTVANYVSDQDLIELFNKRVDASKKAILHHTVGSKHGNKQYISEEDINGFNPYLQDEDKCIAVPGIKDHLSNSQVNYILIPIHQQGINTENGVEEHNPAGDHWHGYLLMRTDKGFESVRITPPGDGDCGEHLINYASHIINKGLDSFRASKDAKNKDRPALQSLTADGLSGTIKKDAAKLSSLGIALLKPEELSPISASKKICFASDSEERNCDQIDIQSFFSANHAYQEVEDGIKDFVLDKVFRSIFGYENLLAEKEWIAFRTDVESKRAYLINHAAKSLSETFNFSNILKVAMDETKQEIEISQQVEKSVKFASARFMNSNPAKTCRQHALSNNDENDMRFKAQGMVY